MALRDALDGFPDPPPWLPSDLRFSCHRSPPYVRDGPCSVCGNEPFRYSIYKDYSSVEWRICERDSCWEVTRRRFEPCRQRGVHEALLEIAMEVGCPTA